MKKIEDSCGNDCEKYPCKIVSSLVKGGGVNDFTTWRCVWFEHKKEGK